MLTTLIGLYLKLGADLGWFLKVFAFCLFIVWKKVIYYRKKRDQFERRKKVSLLYICSYWKFLTRQKRKSRLEHQYRRRGFPLRNPHHTHTSSLLWWDPLGLASGTSAGCRSPTESCALPETEATAETELGPLVRLGCLEASDSSLWNVLGRQTPGPSTHGR